MWRFVWPSLVVEDIVVEVEGEAMVEVDLVEEDSLAEEDLEAMVVVEVLEVMEEDMAEVVEDLGEISEEDLAEVLAEAADMEATENKVRKSHQSWSEAGTRMSSGGATQRLHLSDLPL